MQSNKTNFGGTMCRKTARTGLWGDKYLDKLDIVIKEQYSQNELNELDNCGKVIQVLGLPKIFVIPLVDRAFRTHL